MMRPGEPQRPTGPPVTADEAAGSLLPTCATSARQRIVVACAPEPDPTRARSGRQPWRRRTASEAISSIEATGEAVAALSCASSSTSRTWTTVGQRATRRSRREPGLVRAKRRSSRRWPGTTRCVSACSFVQIRTFERLKSTSGPISRDGCRSMQSWSFPGDLDHSRIFPDFMLSYTASTDCVLT